MSISNPGINPDAEAICLSCGLCCNGVIFADVKLLHDESPAPLRALGLSISKPSAKGARTNTGRGANHGWRFLQPCTAFDGCRCRIYPSRPRYCHDFECLLLKQRKQSRVTQAGALRVIRSALRQAEKVRELLRALGDNEETLALAARFHRMTKELTRSEAGPQAARLYGRLTLAFHRLRLTLDEKFYPAPPGD